MALTYRLHLEREHILYSKSDRAHSPYDVM